MSGLRETGRRSVPAAPDLTFSFILPGAPALLATNPYITGIGEAGAIATRAPGLSALDRSPLSSTKHFHHHADEVHGGDLDITARRIRHSLYGQARAVVRVEYDGDRPACGRRLSKVASLRTANDPCHERGARERVATPCPFYSP